MEEYKNKTTREPFIEEFTVDFNTTFTRLEKMQEEIVTKKIEELELVLKELENVALKIINKKL